MVVVVVTGGNRGLGLECVKQLAETHVDWTIYMTARDKQHAEQALKQLQQNHKTIHYDYSNIICEQLDMTCLDSVKTAATNISQRSGKIDYIIANAGLAPSSDLDAALAVIDVNVFGTTRFIEHFEPFCSCNATIIVVGSEFGSWSQFECNESLQQVLNNSDMSLQEWNSIVEDYLIFLKYQFTSVTESNKSQYEWPNPQRTSFSYGISKCLIGLFVRIFHRLHPHRHIVTVCPGWCRTRMTNNTGLRDVSQGARSILWPVHHKQESGRFYQDGRAKPWQYMQPAEWLQI